MVWKSERRTHFVALYYYVPLILLTFMAGVCVCVCVCVLQRERERGNEGRVPDFTYTVFFVFAKLVLLMSLWKQ